MLPSANRLRRSSEFARASRRGVRSRRGVVVVHVVGNSCPESRVGFAVGRGVGGSVERHRTVRRLRAIVRPLLATVPGGFDVVVRCLPGATALGFDELSHDVEQAMRTALAKRLVQ